jgi:long-chain acyl-CoA synthetase
MIMSKVWTVQSGELSPTLKVRRKYMHGKYAALIERMYSAKPETKEKRKFRKKKPGDTEEI